MSYNLGDTWYPHHPDGSPLGDTCKNTRYTVGGDTWYQVVDDFDQDVSWDILNTFVQNTAWDILNDFDQDTAWDILNVFAQATAWDLLNEWSNDTAWNIFPAVIPYIAQFLLRELDSSFALKDVTHGFSVCPIQTNFVVETVIDTNVSMKWSDIITSFKLVPVTYTFSLQHQIVSDFKITRVYNNTRTP